ncbi:hypothetical protein Plec18167_003689 [Paecilomyces lecythidis]|uniref:F-box domain-containing protein n=1 Tax=Paecilomyces lecythidis TaxID=3004212 RepID=A0ABR3XXD0_9EURO
MAPNLPFELLSQIAEYLHLDEFPLSQYTIVCRQWQAAFEPFIYSNLIIWSEEVENMETYMSPQEEYRDLGELWGMRGHFRYPPLPDWCNGPDQNMRKPKKALTLSQLTTMVSGSGSVRRNWICYLKYKIVVPYLLEDWETTKRKRYKYVNPIRAANDKAFELAITKLFKVLSNWGDTPHISLELGLFGLELGKEPCTEGHPDAGDYDWDFTNGRTRSVRPYRARFLNDASVLPNAPCVDQLRFLNVTRRYGGNRNHRVWAGTVFDIAVHCPAMTKLELDLDEYVRPDHGDLLIRRRQADGLTKLPHSLRVFHYKNQQELNWKQTLPALNVLPPSGIDSLSINLRDLSFHLRELKVETTKLSLDFLCPLDDHMKPSSGISSLDWPRLEILHFELVQETTPSGEFLFHYPPDIQAEVDEIDDWEDEICNTERGHHPRRLMNYDMFHRIFISIGYAVQHMPRISHIRFLGEFDREFTFELSRDSFGMFTAMWDNLSYYQPNEQVASAWKFRVEDMEIIDRGWGEIKSTVKFPIWPPPVP